MTGGIDHLILCVRDLEAACDCYRRFGFTLTPPARRGVLRILTPAAFSDRFAGVAPLELTRGPRFAGCYIAVDDLDPVKRLLSGNKIGFMEDGAAVMIAPADAFGLALGFVQRSKC